MTQDELLMLSFTKGWTPLIRLLQNYQIQHLFTNDNNVIHFVVTKNAIGPGFVYDLDETGCCHSLCIGEHLAMFEIYP